MNSLSGQPASATYDSQRPNHRSRGFTLVELVTVVAILLIIGGFATPITLDFIHASRIQGTATDFASLLQVGRIRSIQADTSYKTYILAGPPEEAYVDLNKNGGTQVDVGDPDIEISGEVAAIAATSAPSTPNLKGQFLPSGSTLTVNDGLSTPVVFSPRGLPCTSVSATGGSVCDSSGLATAFWVFFQDNRTQAWVAVTVSPAGRIRRWRYIGTVWASY